MKCLMFIFLFSPYSFAADKCMNKWKIENVKEYMDGNVVDVSGDPCKKHPCVCGDNIKIDGLKLKYAKLVDAKDGSGDMLLEVDEVKKSLYDNNEFIKKAAEENKETQKAQLIARIKDGTADITDLKLYIRLKDGL